MNRDQKGGTDEQNGDDIIGAREFTAQSMKHDEIHFGPGQHFLPQLGHGPGTRIFPVMAAGKVTKMLVRAASGKSAIVDNQRGSNLFIAFISDIQRTPRKW